MGHGRPGFDWVSIFCCEFPMVTLHGFDCFLDLFLSVLLPNKVEDHILPMV